MTRPNDDELRRLADWRKPYCNRHKGPRPALANGYCHACALDWPGFLEHCGAASHGEPHLCEFEEREPEPEPAAPRHFIITQGDLF